MTTIFERVKSAMDTLSPVVAHALHPLKSSTLPDIYITYQLIDGRGAQWADNIESQRDFVVQVNIWKKSGLIGLPNVNAAMIAAGFTPSDERQLPQDQVSGHYGLAKDFTYLE